MRRRVLMVMMSFGIRGWGDDTDIGTDDYTDDDTDDEGNDDTSEFAFKACVYIALNPSHKCLKDFFLKNRKLVQNNATWASCSNSVLNSWKNQGLVPRYRIENISIYDHFPIV